jgi:hypothetical protein
MRTVSKKKTGITLVALSPDDVKHLLKPMRGFDAYAEELVALFRQNPKALIAGDVDLDGLLEDVGAYQSLAQPEAAAARQLASLQTTRLARSSSAWHAMLELYARAVAVGRTDPTIRAAIAPFVAFLKKTNKKAKTPTPVAA